MKPEITEKARAELLKWKREILQEAAPSASQIQGDELYDPVDRASRESDRTFSIRLQERQLKLLKKIDKVLDMIDDGSYGICESCGQEIEEERLLARPVATLCVDCKNEEERLEKIEES